MRSYFRKTVAIAAILATIAGALASCAPAAGSNAVAVKTAAAQKQAIKSQVTVSGVLVSQNSVTISSKMTGEVQAVNVQVGSTVKKGDTLITLDTKQLTVQQRQAQAALTQAKDAVNASKATAAASQAAYKSVQAAADQAKINLDLQQTLFNNAQSRHANGDATMDDMTFTKIGAALDTAKSQYATATGPALEQAKNAATAASRNVTTLQAAVDVAQANLDLVNVSLQNATITSPVDGTVAACGINPGELASVGAQLVTILGGDSLKLKGTIPQSALPMLSVGQAMQVSVDIFPGKTFEGKITLIAPESVTTGQYFPIEISIASADGLKAGLSARASADVQGQEHVTVPASAIITDNGKTVVFTIVNGLAKKNEVVAGLSNGTDTEILSGITQGEEVVSAGADILKDNMPVRKQ